MSCPKEHKETDLIVKDLPISQGSFERHKCASCAYEMGVENGKKKVLNFNLETFIQNLEESQKGLRRHRSALEAYTLGFFHGLHGNNNHIAIKDKIRIASQMKDFGLSVIVKGIIDAEMLNPNEKHSVAMGLVQVANGFEILIKSRIVEEHPLLVFTKFPKKSKIGNGCIKMQDLLEHGQTVMYSELPERLWATTGYKIREDISLFEEVGQMRNQIIHFAIPEALQPDLILDYSFKIIEVAIYDWWNMSLFEKISEQMNNGVVAFYNKNKNRLPSNIDYDSYFKMHPVITHEKEEPENDDF